MLVPTSQGMLLWKWPCLWAWLLAAKPSLRPLSPYLSHPFPFRCSSSSISSSTQAVRVCILFDFKNHVPLKKISCWLNSVEICHTFLQNKVSAGVNRQVQPINLPCNPLMCALKLIIYCCLSGCIISLILAKECNIFPLLCQLYFARDCSWDYPWSDFFEFCQRFVEIFSLMFSSIIHSHPRPQSNLCF